MLNKTDLDYYKSNVYKLPISCIIFKPESRLISDLNIHFLIWIWALNIEKYSRASNDCRIDGWTDTTSTLIKIYISLHLSHLY